LLFTLGKLVKLCLNRDETMNSLVNYGSDDDYDDSSEEKQTVNEFFATLLRSTPTILIKYRKLHQNGQFH
jgi:hypothetical protein